MEVRFYSFLISEHIIAYEGAQKWWFIIPPDEWKLHDTTDVYTIQFRYNYSHMTNDTFHDDRRLVDQLENLNW